MLIKGKAQTQMDAVRRLAAGNCESQAAWEAVG